MVSTPSLHWDSKKLGSHGTERLSPCVAIIHIGIFFQDVIAVQKVGNIANIIKVVSLVIKTLVTPKLLMINVR